MKYFIYHALLSLCLFTSGLQAEEPGCQNDDCIRTTEPVVVSATRWETSGIPTANSITVITRDEIINSGADRIVDVLRTQAGVQIQDFTGDGSRAVIDIRGFGSTGTANTLILIDGRRLNPTDLGGPNINLVSIKDVERIELTKGSNTVLYGDQAVGGVVNIITRTSQDANVDFELGFGSYNYQSQIFQASHQLENGLSGRVSAERRKTDNYRDNNALTFSNGFANLAFDGKRGRLFAEITRTDEDIKLPGALFPAEFALSRKQSTGTGAFNDSISESFRAGGSFSITRNWDFAGEYTVRDDDVDGALNFGGTLFPFKQERLHKSWNPRLRGQIPFGENNITLILGADIEDSDYFISGLTVTNSTQSMESVYGLVTFPLSDNFSITGGLRKAWVENDITDGFAFPTGVTLDDDQTATTIGFSYKPDSNWRLFAKREDNYRFPLIDEETNFFGAQSSLKTQTGESYEAGMEYNQSWFSAKLTGYVLELENELIFNPVTFQNENLEPTTRRGLLIEAAFYPTETLTFNTHFSFINAEFDDGINDGNRIPLVAEHQLNLSANYRFRQYWNLHGDINFVGNRVTGNDFSNTAINLDGYTLSNLHLRYEKKHYFLSAGIRNLFNKKHETSGSLAFNIANFLTEPSLFPAPERNFIINAGIHF